jgi:predicted DNA-binding transcriptional regulator YafY
MRDFAPAILEARLLDDVFSASQAPTGTPTIPGDYREIQVWIDADTVPWARETVGYGFDREEPGEDGSTFVINARDIRRLLPWILGCGAAARVISPPDVIERVASEAGAMRARYSDS